MDAKHSTPAASPQRTSTQSRPPFTGLGFDLRGLHRASAGVSLHRAAPREAPRPAPAARA